MIKSGFDREEITDLSNRLESLGYKYNQPTGLGAGPSPEQIIAWIQTNRILSDVSISVLSSFVYDILKSMYTWFSQHRSKRKTIPVVQLFLSFSDLKDKHIGAEMKFRIDKYYDKNNLRKIVKSQVVFYESSGEDNKKCSICNRNILSHEVYFLKRKKIDSPICIFCKDKLLNEKK